MYNLALTMYCSIVEMPVYHSRFAMAGRQTVINEFTSVADCPSSSKPMAASNASGHDLY